MLARNSPQNAFFIELRGHNRVARDSGVTAASFKTSEDSLATHLSHPKDVRYSLFRQHFLEHIVQEVLKWSIALVGLRAE